MMYIPTTEIGAINDTLPKRMSCVLYIDQDVLHVNISFPTGILLPPI